MMYEYLQKKNETFKIWISTRKGESNDGTVKAHIERQRNNNNIFQSRIVINI